MEINYLDAMGVTTKQQELIIAIENTLGYKFTGCSRKDAIFFIKKYSKLLKNYHK